MKKCKLNFRFHNPNSIEVTTAYLEKLLIEINAHKVELALQEAAKISKDEQKKQESVYV